MSRWLFFTVTIFWFSFAFAQEISFHDVPITLTKGLAFRLKVPEGYDITVAAEGLKRPRFFAKSPDGRLFITDMYDRSDNRRGRVLILDGWDSLQCRFTKVITYLDRLHNPNQVAFYTTPTGSFIYVAETGRLTRYPYKSGDTMPRTGGRVIATFPDHGLSYKYGGWHLTRSLAFHRNKLYVSVGSSCNACIEKEPVRATIIEMNPDGSNPRTYASGLRNSVGIKWIGDMLWVTSMGRDLMGPEKPEDLFHPVKKGAFYGWPFFFQYRGRIHIDPQFRDSIPKGFKASVPLSPWAFRAHAAPLGLEFISNFTDSLLNNSFLVALHGSTSVWRERGNAVVQMLPGGGNREIVTGFLQGKTENKRYGRPCDVMQWDKNSFFISDDKNGVIYFVSHKRGQ